MHACFCNAVTEQTVRATIASGADTVAEITRRCRAGGSCGGCRPLLQELLNAELVATADRWAVSAGSPAA